MRFLSLIPKHLNGALLETKLTALWWQTFITKFLKGTKEEQS